MNDPHDPDNKGNETHETALMGKMILPDEKKEPDGNGENEEKPHSPVPPLMGVPLGPDEKKEPDGNEENETAGGRLMGDVKMPLPDEKEEPDDNEENEEKPHFPFPAVMGVFAKPLLPFLPKKKKK